MHFLSQVTQITCSQASTRSHSSSLTKTGQCLARPSLQTPTLSEHPSLHHAHLILDLQHRCGFGTPSISTEVNISSVLNSKRNISLGNVIFCRNKLQPHYRPYELLKSLRFLLHDFLCRVLQPIALVFAERHMYTQYFYSQFFEQR